MFDRFNPVKSLTLWLAVLAAAILMLLVLGWSNIQLRGLDKVSFVVWTALLTVALWMAITLPVRTVTVGTAIWAFALGVLVLPILSAVIAWPFGLLIAASTMSSWVVPPIEELTKLLPLFLLFRLTKDRVFTGATMGPVDFAVIGLAAGLGFELVEDMFRVKYQVSHLVFDESWGPLGLYPHTEFIFGAWGAASDPFYLRGPSAMFNHGITTGLTTLGIGVSLWSGERLGRFRWAPAGLVILLATWEHVAFNLANSFGRDGPPDWMRFSYIFLTQGGRASAYLLGCGTLLLLAWEAWIIYARRDPRWSVEWRAIGLRGDGGPMRRLGATALLWLSYRRLRAAASIGSFRHRGGTADWTAVEQSVALSAVMKNAIEGHLSEQSPPAADS